MTSKKGKQGYQYSQDPNYRLRPRDIERRGEKYTKQIAKIREKMERGEHGENIKNSLEDIQESVLSQRSVVDDFLDTTNSRRKKAGEKYNESLEKIYIESDYLLDYLSREQKRRPLTVGDELSRLELLEMVQQRRKELQQQVNRSRVQLQHQIELQQRLAELQRATKASPKKLPPLFPPFGFSRRKSKRRSKRGRKRRSKRGHKRKSKRGRKRKSKSRK